MKKLLLTLVAILATSVAFAYEVGDYIYTNSAKFKVISANLAPALNSWYGADDVDTWSVYAEEDATPNSIQSLDGSEGASLLYTTIEIQMGSTYVINYKIKGVAETTSSIAAGAQNELNAFVTAAPSANGVLTGTANTDYIQAAGTNTILNGEWKEVSFSYVNGDTILDGSSRYLNIVFGRLTTGTAIADIEVCEVVSVYDTRISDKRVDFISKLLADENFQTDKLGAATDPAEVQELLEAYEGMKEVGECDDEASMNDFMATMNDAVEQYLAQSSENLADMFQYIGISNIPKVNRNPGLHGEQYGFYFNGDNWLHADGVDYLTKQIQGSYANNAGSAGLYSKTFPAGHKYYVAAEIRNANCDKNYNLTYTLEKNVKFYIGSDTIDLGTIKGEDYKKVYMISELKEGETFEAGFWWEGSTAGSAVHVKGFEVREILQEGVLSVRDEAERANAWNTFKAQWDAATAQRDALLAKLGNTADYPWEQDSLQRAYDTWNVYYQNIIDSKWIDADGNDTYVASNDQLTTWATQQGYDGEETYQLVRNFQWANAYVVAQNQPYTDLKALVAETKSALARPAASKIDTDEISALLSEAERLISNVSATSQYDEFTENLDALNEALLEVKMQISDPDYRTPMPIIDGNFTAKTGNIAGGTTTYWNGEGSGWVSYTTDAKAYFRVGAGDKDAEGEYVYEGVNRAAMWRGWTGNPSGSLTQEFTVTKAGRYVFKCQAYATADDAKVISGVRKVNIAYTDSTYYDEEQQQEVTVPVEVSRDTVYQSGVFLIFGSTAEETLDSLEIWTAGETVANYNPQWFEMYYDKKTDGEEVLRFGLDGLSIGAYAQAGIYTYGPNAYGFGSVTLSYGGDPALWEGWTPQEEEPITIQDISNLIDKYLNQEEGNGGITVTDITDLIAKYLNQ